MIKFESTEILKSLDEVNKHRRFPTIQMQEYYNAGIRLKVFLGKHEWLILFETVKYTETDYTFINSIFAIGNEMPQNGFYNLTEIISEAPGKPFFGEESYDECLLDPFNFQVMIKETVQNFAFNRSDYELAGIDLNDQDIPIPAKIMRILAHKIPDELFFSNEYLLKWCGRENASLKLFLEPSGWDHPDLINSIEQPSDSICFQSIAKAIASRNTEDFNCQKHLDNTHWSNWPWE